MQIQTSAANVVQVAMLNGIGQESFEQIESIVIQEKLLEDLTETELKEMLTPHFIEKEGLL